MSATKSTAWTPGPWTFDKSTGRIGTTDGTVCCLQISAGWCGVGRNLTADEQEANARLISSAPALAEALERVLNALEWSTTAGRMTQEEMADTLRAALAAAKAD